MKLVYSKIKGRLTERKLKEIESGVIFAHGIFKNKIGGILTTVKNQGVIMCWVAIKENKFYNWAILYSDVFDTDYTSRKGQKIRYRKSIEKLVPCDEMALKFYNMLNVN